MMIWMTQFHSKDDSNFLHHEACTTCTSSDGVAAYSNGTKYCFVCNTFYPSKGAAPLTSTRVSKMKKPFTPISGVSKALPKRGLSLETCQQWGYQVGKHFNPGSKKEELCHIANYYEDNKLIGQKIRFEDKNFSTLGSIDTLYGKHLWNKGKFLVITEGELDALSISEAQGNKYPVVSIPYGAQSAVRTIKKELRWIENNFDKVILCFDKDDEGLQATKDVMSLFSPNKVMLANLSEKDANECLVKGKAGELVRLPWDSQAYKPDGIVSVKDLIPKINLTPTIGIDYPWPTLTNLWCGIQSSTFTILISGSGTGKTEVAKTIIKHIVTQAKEKVGVIFLEEPAEQTAVKLAGKLVNKRFDSPKHKFDEKEGWQAINDLADSDLLRIYDNYGCSDWGELMGIVRHLIVSEGCKYIFIDHLTLFTDAAPDPNQIGERMSKDLAAITKELHPHIFAIAHIRKSSNTQRAAEEGGDISMDDTKGSGALKQHAYNFMTMTKATDDDTNTLRKLNIKKSRQFGETVGKSLYLRYNDATGELVEIPESEAVGF